MGNTASLSETLQYGDQPPVRYSSITEVQNGLMAGGLSSANLVLGVDFPSAQGDPTYLNVIKVIGEVFEAFIDREYPIHAFGLGVEPRLGKSLCFPFTGLGAMQDMRDVITKYQELAQSVRSQGGSWAPLVRRAIEVVRKTGRYHVLLILSSDPDSTDEETRLAIQEAARFPMAIVQIGLGSGPWDPVQAFAERGMARSNSMAAMIQTDGFQFLAFDDVTDLFEGETDLEKLPAIRSAGRSRPEDTATGSADSTDTSDWKQRGAKQGAAKLGSSCSAARFAWKALSGLPMHYKAIEQTGVKRTISGWSIGQGAAIAGHFPDPKPFEKRSNSSLDDQDLSLGRKRSATWPIAPERAVEEQCWAHAPPSSALGAQPMRSAFGDLAAGFSRNRTFKNKTSQPDVAASRKTSTLGRMTTLSWAFDPADQVPTGFTGYVPRSHKSNLLSLEASGSTGFRRSSLVGNKGDWSQMNKWGKSKWG